MAASSPSHSGAITEAGCDRLEGRRCRNAKGANAGYAPARQKQLERIFDWAIERGFRADPNPVPRKLRDYFEAKRPRTANHPAMPWADLPQFLQELRARSDLPAACLELQILCCTRPRETRLARWGEVDFENALWTVPASRMKSRVQHRCPLSQPALALLRRLWEWRASELIFPPVTGSAMCAEAVASRIPKDRFLTPSGKPGHAHGFRASFSMWAADHRIDRDIREKCLAHMEKDKTVGGLSAKRFARFAPPRDGALGGVLGGKRCRLRLSRPKYTK
jgi:integrase